MKSLQIALCLGVVLFSTSSATAGPLVIAGSELNAPPAFWDNSFYPITRTFKRAFLFTTIPGGPYSVESLQIAAFHYQGFAGSRAFFSIHEDSQGLPGAELTGFLIHNISTVAQVHELVPSQDVILESDTLYWITGYTPQTQVNWNLGDSTFGQTAFLRPNDPWTLQEDRNVAAFAILGTPIPEPSSIGLAGFMALGVGCFRKRRHIPLH